MKPCYVHLRVHSDYSIFDGLSKVESLVKYAADMGMCALAITDNTNLFGFVKFYQISYKFGIKPIVGVNVFIKNFNQEIGNLVILATDNIGYQNLIYLISKSYKKNVNFSQPIVDYVWLIKFRKGLILLSGATNGDLGIYLKKNDWEKVEKCLSFYNHYFPNKYYVEIMRTGRKNEEIYLHSAIKLARYYNLPIVSTNDVKFLKSEDFYIHKVRVAISNGDVLHDGFNESSSSQYSKEQYMKSEMEMKNIFYDIPESIENTIEIAKRCNVILSHRKQSFPKFPTGNLSSEDYLIKKSYEGLKKKLPVLFFSREKKNLLSIYKNRLKLELDIINQKKFPDYFLIVMEFVQWAKENKIPVGPGRGSGAGSLVAYVLDITDLDPIKFNLVFERFLNLERISMPDLDIDFCMKKRDLVIDHLLKTYGNDAVAQIITFGTMAAKASIRDVGRVLGYSYEFVDKIAKLIPVDSQVTLSEVMNLRSELKVLYDSDQKVKNLVDIAKRIEGVIRNIGRHAGGIVISPTKITDFSPVYYDDDHGNYLITHFDKDDIEYIGLVKFDLLGLRTLTVIDLTVQMINLQKEKLNLPLINIKDIPLDDKKSFQLLRSSKTIALFQLESFGMQDLIIRLKPDSFEDIIALIALFRPGPLQSGMVDNFINRKHGKENIFYPDKMCQHELLKPILKSTYGIILYQEQVMKISQTLAGYTLAKADMLRRAMGKKKPKEMFMHRSIFRSGALSIGIEEKLSMKIFDLMEKFARYGFNKSHSTAYALLSYQTLWLKSHYPSEFMASVMSLDMDNVKKLVELIKECKKMEIKIIPPDVNASKYHFYVNKKKEIIYGIGAIKGIGKKIAEEIINIRKRYGKFKSIFDFCIKINDKLRNKGFLEKLILSGSFDLLYSNRLDLMISLDHIVQISSQYSKIQSNKQLNLFKDLKEHVKDIDIIHTKNYDSFWDKKKIIFGEKEVLGTYLTCHPMDQYKEEVESYIKNLSLSIRENELKHGSMITTSGLIVNIRTFNTQYNEKICVCTVENGFSQFEIIFYTDMFDKYKNSLKKDQVFVIHGKVYKRNRNSANNITNINVVVFKLLNLNEIRRKYVESIKITLKKDTINDKKILKCIKKIIQTHKFGTTPMHIYHCDINGIENCINSQFKNSLNVNLNDHLIDSFRTLLGNECIKFQLSKKIEMEKI